MGHVQKRIGTRLRNARKVNKLEGKKLADRYNGGDLGITGPPPTSKSRTTECTPQPAAESWFKSRRTEATGALTTFKYERVPMNLEVIKAIQPI